MVGSNATAWCSCITHWRCLRPGDTESHVLGSQGQPVASAGLQTSLNKAQTFSTHQRPRWLPPTTVPPRTAGQDTGPSCERLAGAPSLPAAPTGASDTHLRGADCLPPPPTASDAARGGRQSLEGRVVSRDSAGGATLSIRQEAVRTVGADRHALPPRKHGTQQDLGDRRAWGGMKEMGTWGPHCRTPSERTQSTGTLTFGVTSTVMATYKRWWAWHRD